MPLCLAAALLACRWDLVALTVLHPPLKTSVPRAVPGVHGTWQNSNRKLYMQAGTFRFLPLLMIRRSCSMSAGIMRRAVPGVSGPGEPLPLLQGKLPRYWRLGLRCSAAQRPIDR